MMVARLECHSEMIRPELVLRLGSDAPSRQFIALFTDDLNCFGTESISTVRKTNGFWYPHALQLEFDQGQLASEAVCVSGNRETIMRPAMISDFEPHLINLFDI